MHALIGYCGEDWNQRSMFEFQIAIDEIEKFQVMFNSNSIAMLWDNDLRIHCNVAFDPK